MKKYIEYSELGQTPAINYEKIGKVTAESVQKHTGKDWKQWIALLEKSGAPTWTYQELVAYLREKKKLTPWWQNQVAMGFEIAIGRRKAGQDIKGKYMVTATKSLPVSAQRVWKFIVSAEGQKIWLKPLSPVKLQKDAHFETEDGFFGQVRTVTANRRIRLFWQDPLWEKHTVVELLVVSKPGKKSLLVFNHTGIREAQIQARLRARWRQVADGVFGAVTSEDSHDI